MSVGTAILRVPKEAKKGETVKVQMVITHPMTVPRRDPQTGKEEPGHYLTKMVLYYNDKEVSVVNMAQGVAANPYFGISLRVDESGVVKVVYEDNMGGKWEKTAEIKVV
ncbi:Sulphur oxidation protein SoxZ [Thermocrinis albus DSM 14484]|uniref:Sulphur oxidation protein SoxZ n=1 Tax=Thermocrinis albus (strain DSM 14484 / JCM 11386 / HI 11/12) TaxID=638303 RepID=D3SQG2_THEAH|nr:thiosulfate oxidation carrier complex protein SoxZ [Thermocrinis albus]ADC89399.1 Sulphur oxidation protein SoxZ [Thermocrinis albus DSM 14484]